MDIRFDHRTAIVTGAGQGIGLRICQLLVESGARVVLNDSDSKLCAAASEQLGDACAAVEGDCSRLTTITKMVSTAREVFGGLDLVIANAGITLFGAFSTYSEEQLDQLMAVNIKGSFLLAQQASNEMIRLGKGGSILFTSSVTGHQAHRNLAAYGMSKAAVEMLAKQLVAELSEHRINVNAIAPGATLTERTMNDADYETTWSRITPMGRPASVDEVAKAALFFVSQEARHITGQSVVIDGGWTSISPSPY